MKLELEQMLPPRPREEVLANIEGELDSYEITQDRKERLMNWIVELEDGAWQAGADEGYDLGSFNASCAAQG